MRFQKIFFFPVFTDTVFSMKPLLKEKNPGNIWERSENMDHELFRYISI